MTGFGFCLPTRVVVGVGASQSTASHCRTFGRRVLVVHPAEPKSLARPVLEHLAAADLEVCSVAQTGAEPTTSYIDVTAAELQGERFDCIVAVGGGSAIDLAKSLAIALTHSEPIWDHANLSDRPPVGLRAAPLPVIALPTTSGTGSEVTPYAVLTRSETHQKGTIQEPAIFPRVAILDATLLTRMPAELTRMTGLDAFAHALEATLNVSKAAPAAELFGLRAMRTLASMLPRAVSEPDDLEVREAIAWASTLAGMAIAHRGTTTAHAIAESLGALTHLPHAPAVALCTRPVLRRSLPHLKPTLARLNPRVFASCEASFLDNLDALFESLHMPDSVAAHSPALAQPALVSELLDSVLRFKFRPLAQHPVTFDRAGLEPIVNDILFGAATCC